jgi:hypothetical protein
MTKPKAILYSEHSITWKDRDKKPRFTKENAMKNEKNDYTHITVILDRTGSMESIRDDIIGGFNAFLEEQQKLPGKATMTLVQFDSRTHMRFFAALHLFLKSPSWTEMYISRGPLRRCWMRSDEA